MQFQAPLVWTTLALTLHADGRAEFDLLGASPFPRHWVYDGTGELSLKAGLTDYAAGDAAVAREHTLGRRGLAGRRHRGRDGTGAPALRGCS